ncbi:MAG: hypothetical protein NTV29_13260 [Planctomycetota bacterium]|nr:hypothetical protein [Planctomycetota bacterium]
MDKRVVFFIDDEDSMTLSWRNCLGVVFDVKYYNVYPGFEPIYNDIISYNPCVIIQDVMMKDARTKIINIEAGIEIAEAIKDTLVKLRIPLIFFSNREFPDFGTDFSELDYPPELLYYRSKLKVGYQTLLKEVNDVLSGVI